MRVLINLVLLLAFTACKKESGSSPSPDNPGGSGGAGSSAGTVSGKVTDSKGNALAGIKVTVEHTVWYASYVFATTDNGGNYKVKVPAEPAGSWTAKAQLEKSAYGNQYKFDLVADTTDAFTRDQGAVRNFTWKLSGQRPDGGSYGAHVDIYQFGTDVDLSQVRLLFTPLESVLIDGMPAVAFERPVHDVAGTFMVTDVPIGKYTVKAIYPGKTLLLDNRHEDDLPAVSQPIVFGKYGYLGETEYNIEFYLSE